MEITNISGPDMVPTGFTAEAPRSEQTREQYEDRSRSGPVSQEPGKGDTIDTYA